MFYEMDLEKLDIDDNVIIEYARLPIDPLFSIDEIMKDKKHYLYNVTMENIDKISKDYVDLFDLFPRWKIQADSVDYFQRELHLKKIVLINYIQTQIASLKFEAIVNDSNNSFPYNSIGSDELKFDKDNLLIINRDNNTFKGFVFNGHCYLLSPITPSLNSNWWLQKLFFFSRDLRGSISVRLDPYSFYKNDDYTPLEYRMTQWGRNISWARLLQIKEIEQGRWIPENMSLSDSEFTDYCWFPKKDEIHFTCEEVRIRHSQKYYLPHSRYFHAIISTESQQIVHCDGGWRFFDDDEYSLRLNRHIKDSDITKLGRRKKLFRINTELKFMLLSDLVKSFFVWNDDVINYFNELAI